jgi:hypothetical protein
MLGRQARLPCLALDNVSAVEGIPFFGNNEIPDTVEVTVPPLDPNSRGCKPRDLSTMVDRLLAYSEATLEVF